MKLPSEIDEQLSRLRETVGARTDTALASALGITQGGISSAKRRGKVPDRWFVKTAGAFGVNLEWLHTGKGPMRGFQAQGAEFPDLHGGTVYGAGALELERIFIIRHRQIPLIALSPATVAGWHTPVPLAVCVASPPGFSEAGTFAVAVAGNSMQPDGICQGHVVFCAPSLTVENGDAVYVEMVDGRAGIRRYLGEDAEWLYFLAWREPDADGRQAPFNEKVPLAALKTLTCVSAVRRKAEGVDV